ncbi:hypothetical protein FA15DRAFT_756478 [Coprinopsis marcescibilis]|uniref:Uncharacterized protein n=1 Tax=Coprinopsis marcescibilis TaxID=230819 RepID=A0A5C3KVD9_COPMA|nr:hypothetical protein FA15DRAFT_756478 [Coprinopsis marcescibilis]
MKPAVLLIATVLAFSQFAWAETAELYDRELAEDGLEDAFTRDFDDFMDARDFDEDLDARDYIELEERAPVIGAVIGGIGRLFGTIGRAIAKRKAKSAADKKSDIANGLRSSNGKKISGYKQAKKAFNSRRKRSFDEDEFTLTARSILDLVEALEERGLDFDETDVAHLLRRSFENLSDLD